MIRYRKLSEKLFHDLKEEMMSASTRAVEGVYTYPRGDGG